MSKILEAAKALAGAVLSAVIQAVSAEDVTWKTIVAAALGAVVVYLVPNKQPAIKEN